MQYGDWQVGGAAGGGGRKGRRVRVGFLVVLFRVFSFYILRIAYRVCALFDTIRCVRWYDTPVCTDMFMKRYSLAELGQSFSFISFLPFAFFLSFFS